MSNQLLRDSFLAVVGVLTWVAGVSFAAEVRTWSAASGKYTVDAEYLGVKPGDVVQLKTKDGRTIEVPLSQLSAADRDYARRQQSTASSRLTKAQKDADRCRSPEDALVVYKVFHDDPATSPADKAIAAAQIAELKQLAADKKVRLNKKWVSADEAAAVRKQADELMRQGLELWKLDQEEAFKRKFAEASRLEPEEIRADFLAALIYTANRSIDKALPIFQRCLARDPENVAVLNNIAMLSAARGEWPTMLASWRRALQIQPDQRVIHNVGRFLSQSTEANVNVPKAPRDALAGPYAELVGSGKFEATDEEVGWLFLLIEESDLDIDFDGKDEKEDEKKSVRPEATEDGPVVGGGTGFVVHPGYVLTNAHVATDDGTFEIQAADGKLLKATRVGKAEKADLALLKCEELTAPPLTLAADLVPRGSDIMLLGFPEMFNLGATLKATRGSISSVPDAQINDMYLYDAVTNSGNSGGPVCDNCGNVVAVHAAGINTASRYGGGVPSTQARDFLKLALPEAQAAAAKTAKLDWPDVDRQVAPSTVLIWVRKKDGNSSGPRSSVGTDLIELPLCLFCGGGGKLKCVFPGCAKGIVTRNGNRAACPSCEGGGGIDCKVCSGVGIDVQLASVRRAIERAQAAKLAASGGTSPSNTVTPPPTGPTPSTSPGTKPTSPTAGSGPKTPARVVRAATNGKPINTRLSELSQGVGSVLGYDPGLPPQQTMKFGDAQYPQIMATLRGGSQNALRDLAMQLFTAVPDPRYQAEVAMHLERWADYQPNWVLRTNCVRALAVWNRPQSTVVLQKALKDRTWPVRRQAGIAIAQAHDMNGIPALVDSLLHAGKISGADQPTNASIERAHWKKCLIVFGPDARAEVEKLKDHSDPAVSGAVSEILADYDQ